MPPNPSTPVSHSNSQAGSKGNRTRNTGGTLRSHGGNVPILPQDKQCPHCSARFTRSTHLNRHLRTHLNIRTYVCETCGADFTRSDLLARHQKTCTGVLGLKRRSCICCNESKTKCNRAQPCDRCTTRNIICVYPTPKGRTVPYSHQTARSEARGRSRFTLDQGILPPQGTFSDYGSSTAPLGSNSSHIETIDSSTGLDAPIANALATSYRADIFEPLFSDIFGHKSLDVFDPVPPFDEIAGLTNEGNSEKFLFDNKIPWNQGADFDWSDNAPVSLIHSQDNLLNQYMHQFLYTFLQEVPIVHAHTFTGEGKPPVLLDVMRACGALLSKTPEAASFIYRTLLNAREFLLQELSTRADDEAYTRDLLTAAILLQAIGTFHEDAAERRKSSVFHGFLVKKILRSTLWQAIASYVPRMGFENSSDIESAWQEWSLMESCKRAIFACFLQDCCQELYFAAPTYLKRSDMAICFPCEDALWDARCAEDWYTVLSTNSSYGSSTERLQGMDMAYAMDNICALRQLEPPIMMTSFGLFIAVHVVLCELYTTCSWKNLHRAPQDHDTGNDSDIQRVRHGLHNIYICWNVSPDRLSHAPSSGGDAPPFSSFALPFYWLGQISLLAYQERAPPFEGKTELMPHNNLRFTLIRRWLGSIREFLKSAGSSPTSLWHNLQRINLHSSGDERTDVVEDEDPGGLVGFFEGLDL